MEKYLAETPTKEAIIFRHMYRDILKRGTRCIYQYSLIAISNKVGALQICLLVIESLLDIFHEHMRLK